MLLTIDVGNTETKLGVFDGDELHHRWRVTTEVRRTPDEYGVFFSQLFNAFGIEMSVVSAIAIASVVPRLDPILEIACAHFFKRTPVFLRPDKQKVIPVLTQHPAESGADLVAAAIGGRARYGSPLVVISFGTATAYIAVSGKGEYLGVAIAPGIAISMEALFGRTAKLPQIALETPQHAIGRNTAESLQSGIVYGFVGQTEAIVSRIRAELGGEAKLVATGGLAEIVAKQTPIEVDHNLSLNGLRLFYESECG